MHERTVSLGCLIFPKCTVRVRNRRFLIFFTFASLRNKNKTPTPTTFFCFENSAHLHTATAWECASALPEEHTPSSVPAVSGRSCHMEVTLSSSRNNSSSEAGEGRSCREHGGGGCPASVVQIGAELQHAEPRPAKSSDSISLQTPGYTVWRPSASRKESSGEVSLGSGQQPQHRAMAMHGVGPISGIGLGEGKQQYGGGTAWTSIAACQPQMLSLGHTDTLLPISPRPWQGFLLRAQEERCREIKISTSCSETFCFIQLLRYRQLRKRYRRTN